MRKKANGRNISRIFRFGAGWSYQRLQLAPATTLALNEPTPERVFSYPFFDLNFLQPEFIELSNLQIMDSVEDIDIGHRLRTRFGWAAKSLGSSQDALVARADYATGWRSGERILGLLDAGIEGYSGDDGIENGIGTALPRPPCKAFILFHQKLACTQKQTWLPLANYLSIHKSCSVALPAYAATHSTFKPVHDEHD